VSCANKGISKTRFYVTVRALAKCGSMSSEIFQPACKTPSAMPLTKVDDTERTRTIRTAISFSTTPRGGATPLPRRAQPLILLFRSNPPTEGGVIRPRPLCWPGYLWLQAVWPSMSKVQSRYVEEPFARKIWTLLTYFRTCSCLSGYVVHCLPRKFASGAA